MCSPMTRRSSPFAGHAWRTLRSQKTFVYGPLPKTSTGKIVREQAGALRKKGTKPVALKTCWTNIAYWLTAPASTARFLRSYPKERTLDRKPQKHCASPALVVTILMPIHDRHILDGERTAIANGRATLKPASGEQMRCCRNRYCRFRQST